MAYTFTGNIYNTETDPTANAFQLPLGLSFNMGGTSLGVPSNNIYSDFLSIPSFGKLDFRNKAFQWPLNTRIDLTGNNPQIIEGVTTPEQDPQKTQQDPQKFDYNNLSSFLGNAGTTMMYGGAATGNRGLYNAGVAAQGLNQAGSYLNNWQSRAAIDEQIKQAKAGKSTEEAAKIANQINSDAKIQNTASGMGAAGAIADAGRQMLYSDQAASDSGTTNGINQAYDAISSSLMAYAPVGTIVGGAMKAGAFIGDMAQSMGGGTDQMTTTDQIMDSNLLSWNVGLINGFGGKRTDKFGINKDVIAGVGGDYGGSAKDIYNAASLSGKKYGLFSSGVRRDANSKIGLARTMQNKMNNIWKDSQDRFDSSSSMSQLNYLNYSNQVNGGTTAMRVKEGGKLERVHTICLKQGGNIEKEWEPVITMEDPVEEFKQGGVIEWEPTLCEPEFKDGGVIEWEPELVIEEYQQGGELNYQQIIDSINKQKARFVERLKDPNRATLSLGKGQIGTHKLSWASYDSDGGTRYVIYPQIQEINGELVDMSDDWKKALNSAFENNNTVFVNNPEEAEWFTKNYKNYYPGFDKYEKGGKIEDSEPLTSQKNVIPDGALHKNKHHMENTDGLTQKGIPVIDNDGEQQAEIELNEIIFSLEVTKKLENLYKSYSHYTTSDKEKDELAIEAGKLLVQEILFNTEDNTGLIDTLKNGGKINGSTE